MAVNSRADLDAYLDADEIECLICERRFQFLGRHLRVAHQTTAAEYRAGFGLPAGTPLAGRVYRAKRAGIAHRLIADGVITYGHLPQATAAARDAGRGQRAAWELGEQADRASRIEHEMLPPGAQSNTGRDMDHAREYQRTRRAARKGT